MVILRRNEKLTIVKYVDTDKFKIVDIIYKQLARFIVIYMSN